MMKTVVGVLLVVVLNGCVSAFPPATGSWGHGARPMAKGTVALQVHGGGGAGLAPNGEANGSLIPVPDFGIVVGAGGGAALEVAVSDRSLLRIEGGGAQQRFFDNNTVVNLAAGYAGFQRSFTNQFALRLRGGGGVEFWNSSYESFYSPYGGGDVGLVYSLFPDGDLDVFFEGHTGVKVASPIVPGFDGPLISGAIGVGGSAGVNYQLAEHHQLFGALHGDVLGGTTFASSGNLQLGYRAVF
jgi:hypothetical protein